jgi:hypothetical protein
VGLGIDAKVLIQAKNILAKIRGASKKKDTKTSEKEESASKTVSVSQMSFDQRKNNFSMLVAMVNVLPDYKPNETEMQVSSLQKYIDTLQILNNEAFQVEQDLLIARQQRDTLLYAKITGVLALAQQIKAYIKSAFGAKSAEFARVKGIAFSAVKKGF